MHLMLYIWAAACILLLLYYLGVLLPFAFFKGPKPSGKTISYPPLSLIICAKNELFNLQQNLAVWLGQEYPNTYELLIVNDASLDGSAQWLQEQSTLYPNLRVLNLEEGQKRGYGKKGALHMGIDAAKYTHLVLTDADCQPKGSKWLKEMAFGFEQSELVLGYGPLEPSTGGFVLNSLCRWEATYTATTYFSLALFGMPYMGVGRNMAYTKSLFKKGGGFDAHMHIASGDDDLFVAAVAQANKPALILDEDSFMYSKVPASWKAWFGQRLRHLSTPHHYPARPKWMLAILGSAQILFYLLMPVLFNLKEDWAWALFFAKLLIQHLVFLPIFKRLKSLSLLPFTFIWEGISVFFTAFFVLKQTFTRSPSKHQVWS